MILHSALSLTAAELLAVTDHTKIFKANKSEIEILAKKLLSKWHPDKNGGSSESNEITTKIIAFRDKALAQVEVGIWGNSKFKAYENGSKQYTFKYLTEHHLPDFGTQYLGKGIVVTEVPADVSDLASHAADVVFPNLLKKIKEKGAKVEKNFHALLEASPSIFDIGKGSKLIRQIKPAEYLSLWDIREHLKEIPAVHVAWILSRLYDYACLMQYADSPCLGLSQKGIFLNPETHEALILDGWQYANGYGKQAFAVPGKIGCMFPELTSTGIVKPYHIHGMIKRIARECLGDPSGLKLLADKTIPSALVGWLLESCPDRSSREEFKAWELARNRAFPERKFTEFKISQTDLYKE